MIEVGAGCGLTSIYGALRGANVTITDMDIGAKNKYNVYDADDGCHLCLLRMAVPNRTLTFTPHSDRHPDLRTRTWWGLKIGGVGDE